jgi:hypothetical protein
VAALIAAFTIFSLVLYFLIYHVLLIFEGITQSEYAYGVNEREEDYFKVTFSYNIDIGGATVKLAKI